jgi:thioredoxin
MARPIAVTDEDFETQVEQSALPVLVDFWAKWCGPCKMLGPVVEQIAKDSEGLLTVVKLDVDHNPEVPRKWGVSSLPTLLLFKDGEPVERIRGFRPKVQLLKLLSKHVEGLGAARPVGEAAEAAAPPTV